jgi:hypothetical protein
MRGLDPRIQSALIANLLNRLIKPGDEDEK